MKQLNLFGTQPETPKPSQTTKKWYLYVDGASRNNPGKAGAGVYLVHDKEPVYKNGFFLGIKTNNQAEYLALLLGLIAAAKHMPEQDTLVVRADSQLLVRQLLGVYRVKNAELKPLHAAALALLPPHHTIEHIMREKNEYADEQANRAVDEKLPIPQEFSKKLHSLGVSI